MRIGYHYRSPACRLLLALVALVYTGALSGGVVVHMQGEAAAVAAWAPPGTNGQPGQPAPFGSDAPDDLDCLLCQVLGSPGLPVSESPSERPALVPAPRAPDAERPGPTAHPTSLRARAPPPS